jgi:hypothetical protein
MGLHIYRCKGFDRVADHAYHLTECLEKSGAFFDCEPVLRVPKRALVEAMKDGECGKVIAKAFGADLEDLVDEDEYVTYYLEY